MESRTDLWPSQHEASPRAAIWQRGARSTSIRCSMYVLLGGLTRRLFTTHVYKDVVFYRSQVTRPLSPTPSRLLQELSLSQRHDRYRLQRSTLFCANVVKEDPGRARQNCLATAGGKLHQTSSELKDDLCTHLVCILINASFIIN